MSENEIIVGIDLGTTNSLVAFVDAGIPIVLADSEGERLLPSIVHYPASGSAPVVGRKARRLRAISPELTISSIKRFMGRRFAEVSAEEKNLPYNIVELEDGRAAVKTSDSLKTPEEISAEILKELIQTAEFRLGQKVTRAVITVPAYFNDAQRQATKRAGELAGLHVERIINEPTAAALAYGLGNLKEQSKIAVFDLGGGTFDLSILELREGFFQVLSTHGDTRLGGDDIDLRLMEFLKGEVLSHRKEPLDLQALARLREAAEEAKIKLSTELEWEISLPFLTPDFSFSQKLTRETLEELARPILQRTHAL